MVTTRAKSNAVEVGLAEMSGVSVCAGPACFRQLKSNEGQRTTIGDRRVHTCFSVSCLSWAKRLAELETEAS